MRQRIIFLMLGASIGIASLGCSPAFQAAAPSKPVVQINAERMPESMSERSQNQTTTLLHGGCRCLYPDDV